ncbi:MAG: Bax inhibitor-1 family protein [Methanobacterium paludis]|nr:Bax inhibitor-1 family protein [Methanobacterium paludis]
MNRNIDRSSILDGFSGTFSPSFDTIMNKFFITLFVSLLGTVVGWQVFQRMPELFMIALGVELVMMISAALLRRRMRIGYGFVYSYVFISGMTLFPALAYYVQSIGFPMVLSAVAITTVGFGFLAFYGYTTKRDLSFMRSMLFMGLIALIGFGLVGLFFPSVNFGVTGLLIATGGVLIFSGYTILDMNMYARYMTSEEEMPWFMLAIYLDYINLLLYVLRLLAILTGSKRN